MPFYMIRALYPKPCFVRFHLRILKYIWSNLLSSSYRTLWPLLTCSRGSGGCLAKLKCLGTASSIHLQFSLCTTSLCPHWLNCLESVTPTFLVFLLFDGGQHSPGGSSGPNNVLEWNRQDVSLLNRQLVIVHLCKITGILNHLYCKSRTIITLCLLCQSRQVKQFLFGVFWHKKIQLIINFFEF